MAPQAFWFFNTDESEVEGKNAHEKMIKQSCMAAWGYCRGQGADKVLRLPAPGDMVFLYRAGYGIVASGICTKEEPFASRTVFAQRGEYHRWLANFKVLPEGKLLSCGTLEKKTM